MAQNKLKRTFDCKHKIAALDQSALTSKATTLWFLDTLIIFFVLSDQSRLIFRDFSVFDFTDSQEILQKHHNIYGTIRYPMTQNLSVRFMTNINCFFCFQRVGRLGKLQIRTNILAKSLINNRMGRVGIHREAFEVGCK